MIISTGSSQIYVCDLFLLRLYCKYKLALLYFREDTAAPESHPGSRNTSFRSVQNYRVHPGIHYSSVGKADVTRVGSGHSSAHTERSRVQREAIMLASDYRPPLSYDSKYGYPV